MSLTKFVEELKNAKIIKKGEYPYILNSITEQDPPLDPRILDECCNLLLKKLYFSRATKILTAEAMGISLSTVISMKTGIPMVIATKRKKDIEDEIELFYSTGYKKDVLHMNRVNKDDKVLIIDDLISTAGTIIALIDGVKQCGAEVVDIGVVFNKVDFGGYNKLLDLGYVAKYLLDVKIINDKIEVTESE